MRGTMLRLLLVGLVLVVPALLPGAAAGGPEIAVDAGRVGDVYRYDVTSSGDTPMELRVLAEPGSRARDRWGVEHATEPYLVEGAERGKLLGSYRCHALAGGVSPIRFDLVSGRPFRTASVGVGAMGGPTVFGSTVETTVVPESFFAGAACPGRAGVARLAAGATPLLSNVVGDATTFGGDAASRPAEPVDFHGRRALRLLFDLALELPFEDAPTFRYTYSATVADGLPGLVEERWVFDAMSVCGGSAELKLDGCGGGTESMEVRITLAGLARGSGPALTPAGGAKPASENPHGRVGPPAGLGLDTRGLDLPYPLDEAVRALETDPTTGFAAWRATRPDAFIVGATYDRRMPAKQANVETDGGWQLVFGSSSGTFIAKTVRLTGVSTPVGPLPAPLKATENGGTAASKAAARPAFVPDAAALAGVISAHGLSPKSIEHFDYQTWWQFSGSPMVPPPLARASDVSVAAPEKSPSQEGRLVFLDGATAAAMIVAETSSRTKPVGLATILLPPERDEIRRASIFGGIPTIPSAEAGVAVGAAGLVIALAVKLVLVPLYTRLARDRLLKHPMRARLFEVVRREPGIHLAGLAADAGFTQGATRHHVAKLVAGGYLAELRDEGFARLYVAGAVPPEAARKFSALRGATHRRVYELYAAEPRLSLREAATRLGLSAPTVFRSVRKLRAAGLLAPPSPPPPR